MGLVWSVRLADLVDLVWSGLVNLVGLLWSVWSELVGSLSSA